MARATALDAAGARPRASRRSGRQPTHRPPEGACRSLPRAARDAHARTALMLTPFDDTPWHQLPAPFDTVGTSDPRFFDRLWFAATDPGGGGTMQFTLGVYQNMNVVDGGFVAI